MSVPRPTVEFVIARFNEDVEWVNEWLPVVDRVTIYNKGEPLTMAPHPKIVVKASPNLGREAEVYATHFVDRQDLCDTIVCTQAHWQDHMSSVEFERMIETKTRGVVHGLDVAWTQCPMQHFGFTVDKNHSNPPQPMQPANMSMAKFYFHYIAGPYDDVVPEANIDWWHFGIFVTTKEQVLKHPSLKYELIRQAVCAGSNPEAAIIMERMWKLLLDP